MTYNTALFDLDGVLWNSESAHFESFQNVADQLKNKYPNLSDSLAETWIFGIQTSQVFLNAFSKLNITVTDIELEYLVRIKRDYAKKVFDSKSKSLINSDSLMLASDFKNCGYKLGLVSGSSKQNVDLFLRASKSSSVFDIILNSNDFLKNKPSPDPYLFAMKSLQVRPDQCIVIEDSQAGIASARSAGIREILHYPDDLADFKRIRKLLKKHQYNSDRD